MDTDFALHITWTCYGTWLPGDERGYVSNTLQQSGEYRPAQNSPGTAYTKDDVNTRHRSMTLQQRPTVYLSAPQAFIVVSAIVECAAKRGWHIAQCAVMAAHVHVVVMNCPADGPAVRRVLKGNTQAALSRNHGSSRRWWTENGSDRYKNDLQAIENAVNYVARQEGMLAGVSAMIPFTIDS